MLGYIGGNVYGTVFSKLYRYIYSLYIYIYNIPKIPWFGYRGTIVWYNILYILRIQLYI